MLVGAVPIASRPIASLPKPRIGAISAVLTIAGLATVAMTSRAPARAVTTMAGVGAFAPTITGATRCVMITSGLGAYNAVARSAARSVMATAGVATAAFPASSAVLSAMASAGAAAVTSQGISIARSAMTSAGGATFSPVLQAKVSSVATFSGFGSFTGDDTQVNAASFAGTSSFIAVSYAFYLDAERTCVHAENTTAVVAFEDRVFCIPYEDRDLETIEALVSMEDRIAIVPYEDRVYRIEADRPGAGSSPRKRVC